MDCNDSIKDRLGLTPSQNEFNIVNEDFEKCAIKCVDNYCDLLPVLERTLKNIFAGNNFETDN